MSVRKVDRVHRLKIFCNGQLSRVENIENSSPSKRRNVRTVTTEEPANRPTLHFPLLLSSSKDFLRIREDEGEQSNERRVLYAPARIKTKSEIGKG